MESVRRYVFPLVWMVIFAIIALALAKLAFFPAGAGTGEEPGADVTPGVSYDEYALVPAQLGDISSVLELSATVEADAPEHVTADRAGEITEIWVKDGDRIEKGARILEVRVEQQPEPAAPAAPAVDENGQPVEAPAPQEQDEEPTYRYYTLEAEHTGYVRELAVEKWDDIAEDAQILDISPGTYSVVAPLTPEQQLDLMDAPVAATMTLPTSPDPITCEDSAIEESAPSEAGSGGSGGGEVEGGGIDPMTGEPLEVPGSGGGSGTAQAELRCAVPADAKVVPGLAVDVHVDLGSATGVVTVPTTAVEGELADGAVYVLDEATGEPVRQEVTLGLRGDGIVEITGGLSEGDEILEFVPGVDNPEDGMMMEGEVW